MLFLCEIFTFPVQYRTSHLSNNGMLFLCETITFLVQYRTSHLSNNGSCFYVKQLLFLYNIVHHIYQIMEVVFM